MMKGKWFSLWLTPFPINPPGAEPPIYKTRKKFKDELPSMSHDKIQMVEAEMSV